MALPALATANNTLGPRLGGQAVRRLQYPSPFFDLASTYLPKNVKELFRFCEYYFMNNAIINAAISKMSEYPITDIILDMSNDDMKNKWESLFEDHLSLRAFLIECGLDFYTFGNCYVSISYPFQKILTCKACGAEINAERHMDSWKFHNFKFEFKKCPRCKSKSKAAAKDLYINNIPKIRLIRWDPKRIIVQHSSTTGHSYYFYAMPKVHNNDLALGRKHVVVKTPQMFILAAKKNKPLKFFDGELYHLKRPIISGHSSGYGMPLMMPALKDAFFLQILKKSTEQIAVEHIVPLRLIFPQSASSSGDVMQNVALRQWRDQIWGELHKWKQDSNYMPLLGFPVGYQSIGGDGKSLLLTQEIGVWTEQIIVSMGVPRDLLYGGLSFSGSNVSLRMLENAFLGYRNQQLKLVEWLIDKLGAYLRWDKPNARFREFKMADDMQQKMFKWQMNQSGKISDATMLAECDLDPSKEDDLMNDEMKQRLATLKTRSVAEAEIAGEAQLAQARYGVKVQEETMKLQSEAQARLEAEQADQQKETTEALLMGQSPLSLQKSNPKLTYPQPVMDLRQIPSAIVEKMKSMDPAKAKEWMSGLEDQAPEIASLVKQEQAVGMGSSGMKDLPEQLPPRRLAGTI